MKIEVELMNLKRKLFLGSFILIVVLVSYTVTIINYNEKTELELHTITIGDPIIEDLPDYNLVSHDRINLSFEFRNTTDDNFKLTYSSSKKYKFILHKDGEEVYSMSQMVLYAFEEKTLGVNEREIYKVNLDKIDIDPGTYEYEVYSVARQLKEVPHLRGSITFD